jgi:hypothetical protein
MCGGGFEGRTSILRLDDEGDFLAYQTEANRDYEPHLLKKA